MAYRTSKILETLALRPVRTTLPEPGETFPKMFRSGFLVEIRIDINRTTGCRKGSVLLRRYNCGFLETLETILAKTAANKKKFRNID